MNVAAPQGRFFEDFTVGDEIVTPSYRIHPADVVAFRRMYGGTLVAAENADDEGGSRLHVSLTQLMPIAFRLLYDTGELRRGMGSPGMDEVRYHHPVFSGESIRVVAEIASVRPSSKRMDRGSATLAISVYNQEQVLVLSFSCIQIVQTRTKPT
jgi:acyl dehydratase